MRISYAEDRMTALCLAGDVIVSVEGKAYINYSLEADVDGNL